MLQKLGKLIKFLIVSVLWSVVWLTLTQKVIVKIWNFNFLETSQWRFVSEFWRRNGTFYGKSDYLLFLSLLIILILWGIGLYKLYKVNYVRLFLKPLEYFSNRQIEKYAEENKRVVIKNLVVGEKITIDDLIAEKIHEEEKEPKIKESEALRQNISQKIIERKGK